MCVQLSCPIFLTFRLAAVESFQAVGKYISGVYFWPVCGKCFMVAVYHNKKYAVILSWVKMLVRLSALKILPLEKYPPYRYDVCCLGLWLCILDRGRETDHRIMLVHEP